MTRRSSVSKMPTPWLTQRPADVTAAALSIRASCKHACCRLPGRLSAEIAPFPGCSRNLRHTIWPQDLKHRWHCCKRMLKDCPKPLLWSPFAKNCEAMWKDSVRSRYCGKGRRAMKTEKVMEKTCSFSPAGPWANNGFALALALCAFGFGALGVLLRLFDCKAPLRTTVWETLHFFKLFWKILAFICVLLPGFALDFGVPQRLDCFIPSTPGPCKKSSKLLWNLRWLSCSLEGLLGDLFSSISVLRVEALQTWQNGNSMESACLAGVATPAATCL